MPLVVLAERGIVLQRLAPDLDGGPVATQPPLLMAAVLTEDPRRRDVDVRRVDDAPVPADHRHRRVTTQAGQRRLGDGRQVRRVSRQRRMKRSTIPQIREILARPGNVDAFFLTFHTS